MLLTYNLKQVIWTNESSLLKLPVLRVFILYVDLNIKFIIIGYRILDCRAPGPRHEFAAGGQGVWGQSHQAGSKVTAPVGDSWPVGKAPLKNLMVFNFILLIWKERKQGKNKFWKL